MQEENCSLRKNRTKRRNERETGRKNEREREKRMNGWKGENETKGNEKHSESNFGDRK